MAATFSRGEVDSEAVALRLLYPELERSPAQRLRLERLRLAMSARGIALFDPQAERWLAPVVCQNREQRREFGARFARAAAVARPSRYVSTPEPPAIEDGPGVVVTPPHRLRRAWIWGAIAVAVVLALAAFLALRPRPSGVVIDQATIQDNSRSSPQGKASTSNAPASPQQRTRAQTQRLHPWRMAGLLLASTVPLWLVAVLTILERRRRRELYRDELLDPARATDLAVSTRVPALFAEPAVAGALINLGLHGTRPGERLDVRRSIAAALRRAGYPVSVRAERPLVPEYALCIDEASPRDHLVTVADALLVRMRRAGIAVRRFGFFEDPTLMRDEGGRAERCSLQQVVAGAPDTRVLFFCEANRLLGDDGALQPGLLSLPSSVAVALLDPRAEASWSGDEETLQAADIPVFPVSADGLTRYAAWIRGRRRPTRLARRHRSTVDLATLIERRRNRLLSEDGLPPFELDELVDDLEDWLGAPAMRLLRAGAVFPRLEPALTLLLAGSLSVEGSNRILESPDFVQVLRLVWMRAGRMPNSLRLALVHGLSADDLRVTVAAIRQFLVEDAPGGLRSWLQLAFPNRGPRRPRPPQVLHDRILVDALDGRAPRQLGVQAPDSFARRLRDGTGDGAQRLRLAAALTVGVLVAAISQPLWFSPERAPPLPEAARSTPPAAKPPAAKPPVTRPPEAAPTTAKDPPRVDPVVPAGGGTTTRGPGSGSGSAGSTGTPSILTPAVSAPPTDSRPAEIPGPQRAFLDAQLRSVFGTGLRLETADFRFGSSYTDVNRQLSTPFQNDYATYPRAGEYGPDDVRYFWVTIKDLPGLEALLRGGQDRCIDPQSYIAFLFKDRIFFHTSIRLVKTASCPSYDWARDMFFGPGNHGVVDANGGKTDVSFHETGAFSILEVTRLGVAALRASSYDERDPMPPIPSSKQAAVPTNEGAAMSRAEVRAATRGLRRIDQCVFSAGNAQPSNYIGIDLYQTADRRYFRVITDEGEDKSIIGTGQWLNQREGWDIPCDR